MKKYSQLLGIVVVLTMVCCLFPAVCAERLSTHPVQVSSPNEIANAAVFEGDMLTLPSTVTYLTKWGSNGSANGQFYRPYGIAVNSSGYVYVADSYNYRIQVFSPSGGFIAQWGSYGTGNGQFNGPFGIAKGSTGWVYVTDVNNNRIQRFAP
jgi:hypothetical protein